MKSRLQFLRVMRWCVLVLFAVSVSFASSKAWAQNSPLDQTTLGKTQNSSQDLINSLIPGEQKFGKGEKKQQINATELKSKTIKDSTFGGSLLNSGIVGSEPRLDEQKAHSVASEKPSGVPKQTVPSNKEPNTSSQSPDNGKEPSIFTLSTTATLERELDESQVAPEKEMTATTSNNAASAANTGDNQKKDPSGTTPSSNAEEKSSSSSTVKPTASKPDGDH